MPLHLSLPGMSCNELYCMMCIAVLFDLCFAFICTSCAFRSFQHCFFLSSLSVPLEITDLMQAVEMCRLYEIDPSCHGACCGVIFRVILFCTVVVAGVDMRVYCSYIRDC